MKKHSFPILVCFLLLGLWLGCKPTRCESDVLRESASLYAGYLLRGEYEKYVDGLFNIKEYPDEYRSELIDLYKQHMESEEVQNKGGWESVTVLHDTIYGSYADVFMEVLYKDGGKEEILIPMVYDGKDWRLR
jgi:1-aminocyclopropane-1-carboxylate deaminase/D-cysteine desulfhydrase-like pyridoxal-dependent ACC family enzyme